MIKRTDKVNKGDQLASDQEYREWLKCTKTKNLFHKIYSLSIHLLLENKFNHQLSVFTFKIFKPLFH